MPVLYYITDRAAFPGNEATRRKRLLKKISEAAGAGIDYIQLREKDLSARELERLSTEAVRVIADTTNPATALLINSRADIALATGAAGVHLRSNDISPTEVREIWSCGAGALARELCPRVPMISIACHSSEEVTKAASNGADLALFAPVFEKKDAAAFQPTGLSQLREACRHKIPVLALGGITLENARACLDAGAAGIAAIRLFQDNDIANVIRKLRA
jgi:thiamine-phosphate pyrophosphorylase